MRVGLIWVIGRLFTVAVVLTVARQQGPNPWSPSHPGYLDYIDGWDAGWYGSIFSHGYPATPSTDASGAVEPDRWAFLPLFPALVKALSILTGLPWRVGAPLVATIASLFLCLVLYQLFVTRGSAGTALFAVALVSFQPAAPILQFGYAESLGLLLVAAVLLLVVQGRFLAAIPLVLLLSVCRPTQPPLTLALGLVLLTAWSRRLSTGTTTRSLARLGLLTAVTAVSSLIWPVVVAAVTGVPDGYLRVESSWHGKGHLVPFELWALVGRRIFGPWLGLLAPVLVALAFLGILLSAPGRRIGRVMWAWTASYLLYLMAVAVPNGSIARLLLGAFPLLLAAAHVSRSRAYRVTLLVFAAVLQIVWVAWLWQWSGHAPGGEMEANP